jgi:hypothetical protein
MGSRPKRTPWARARLRPSPVRTTIKCRSNSVSPPSTVTINRPCGTTESLANRKICALRRRRYDAAGWPQLIRFTRNGDTKSCDLPRNLSCANAKAEWRSPNLTERYLALHFRTGILSHADAQSCPLPKGGRVWMAWSTRASPTFRPPRSIRSKRDVTSQRRR